MLLAVYDKYMRKGGVPYLRATLVALFAFVITCLPLASGFLYLQPSVARAGSYQMPSDITAIFNDYGSNLHDYFIHSEGLMRNGAPGANEAKATDGRLPIFLHMYEYYILAKNDPTKLVAFDHEEWATSMQTLYDDIYRIIGDTALLSGSSLSGSGLDVDWSELLKLINDDVYDAKGDTWAGSSNYDALHAKLQEATDLATKSMVPKIADIYGGLQLMQLIVTTKKTELDASLAHTDIKGGMPLTEVTKDLDVLNSKRLRPSQTYEKDLYADSGVGVRDSAKVYGSLGAFYTDFRSYVNVLLAYPATAGDELASVTTMKTDLVTAAKAMDALKQGDVNTAITGNCGKASSNWLGLPNAGEAMSVSFCNIVVLWRGFAADTFDTSLQVLARVSGMNGSGLPSGTSDNWLVHILPQEVESGDFVNDIVNGNGIYAIVREAHGYVLSMVNFLLVLAFILMALSNILQIQVSKYSINKLFAGVVIGFVLAQLSLPAMRATIELSGFLAGSILTQNSTSGGGISLKSSRVNPSDFSKTVDQVGFLDGNRDANFTTTSDSRLPNMSRVFQQFILSCFVIAAAIVILILDFMFIIRALVFYFMTPLSPLAFFASTVPPLQNLWNQWWKTLSGWIFMPVIAAFWLWLGFTWITAASSGGSATGVFSYFLSYCFGMACFILAIKTSTKYAGEATQVLNKWNAVGKKAWDKTGGAGLKTAGKNIGADLKAASGLIPGVAAFKAYQADVKHNTERRRKMWSEGKTQTGATQARKKEEEYVKNKKEADERAKELTDEVSAEATKSAKAVLNYENREKLIRENDALSQEEKEAQLEVLEEELADRKKHFDKMVRAQDNYAKRIAAIEKEQEDLEEKRFSEDGLGWRGKAFAKASKRSEVYAARHKEHDTDVELAKATAKRELSDGDSKFAEQYRHLIDQEKDSQRHISSATALTRFKDTTRYNRGLHHNEKSNKHTEEQAAWRRDSASYGSTLDTIMNEEAKRTSFMGSVHNYSQGKPQRKVGQSDESYNLEMAVWDQDETQAKAFAREQGGIAETNKSVGEKYRKHAIAMLRNGSYEDIIKQYTDPNSDKYDAAVAGNVELQAGIVKDHMKAGGNLAGIWKQFGDWSRNNDRNHTIDPSKTKEWSEYILYSIAGDEKDYSKASGPEAELMREIHERSEQMLDMQKKAPSRKNFDNDVAFNTANENYLTLLREHSAGTKVLMGQFYNNYEKKGTVAHLSELLSRDKHAGYSGNISRFKSLED
jgi:hypothetical protein